MIAIIDTTARSMQARKSNSVRSGTDDQIRRTCKVGGLHPLEHTIAAAALRGAKTIHIVGASDLVEFISADYWCLPVQHFSSLLDAVPACRAEQSFLLDCWVIRTSRMDQQHQYKLRSIEDYYAANMALMYGELELAYLPHQMIDTEIYCRHDSWIDPRARVQGPVWIGKNVCISAGAQIGPGAMIGDDCVIGRNAKVTDSVILDRSPINQTIINKIKGPDFERSIPEGRYPWSRQTALRAS